MGNVVSTETACTNKSREHMARMTAQRCSEILPEYLDQARLGSQATKRTFLPFTAETFGEDGDAPSCLIEIVYKHDTDSYKNVEAEIIISDFSPFGKTNSTILRFFDYPPIGCFSD
ncbi:hypothetical protein DNTS_027482 [Danionella cerebrum]|uniref:Uncharacterized protein n=1 Tax=Danionella cerebrum TaxID=2873325 RepID=A0A553RMA5_9TELE|nr:hypothetical protein DNTS_027482 [Danionella translucida]